ncbi:MAG TPA: hypothetical protein VK203_23710 [Nostocaceae cyanobacterium]|nr:hypothetical protein [Nostocaceae cyanobacterium]
MSKVTMVRMPLALKNRLKARASTEGKTLEQAVKEAIELYLNQESDLAITANGEAA